MERLRLLWLFGTIWSLGSCDTVKKVAIIGGGIGGTSAAYFLKKSLEITHPEVSIHLDLFEPRHIGGRLKSIELGGKFYEAGGSIIHPSNRYMQQFAKYFGLQQRDTDGIDSRFGLFNGTEFVFEESEWGTIVTLFQMLYRYGLDVIKLQWQTKSMIGYFSNIYKLQSEGESFDSAEEILAAMSQEFPEQMTETLKESLAESGFSERFVDELVTSAVLVNYGQTLDFIQAFVGNVALAGAESGLWSIKGGNEQVPNKLLEESRANHQKLKVTEMDRNEDSGKYSILADDENNDHHFFIDYDAVLIAFPLLRDRTQLKFSGLEKPEDSFGVFHRTVATFVRGEPKWSNWCPDIKTSACPTEIMGTGKHWQNFYNSIGLLVPVDYKKGDKLPEGDERVWKIFSDASLSNEQLKELFTKVKEKKEIPWLAYPEYRYSDRAKSLRFRLAPGLIYANAVEWAASVMEMSVIGGRNAALLTEKELFGSRETRTNKKKKEL